MRIERIGLNALDRFRAIRLAALEDAPDAFGSTLAEEEGRPPEGWKTHLEKETAATWLATVDDETVGMIVGDRYAGASGAAGLFGMWVHPGHRGQGIGDRLVQSVVDWARAQGYGRLLLDVGDDNPWARRLYGRHGFHATGETGTVSADRPQITEHQLELVL